jgi:hypothetical protein
MGRLILWSLLIILFVCIAIFGLDKVIWFFIGITGVPWLLFTGGKGRR